MKDRYLNGYKLIYKPEHENSMQSDNWKGYVYEHIYVMSKHLGRPLTKDEHVHHMDFDSTNNNIKNLMVLSQESHSKLHKWIESGCQTINNTQFERCKVCQERLYLKQLLYCSNICRNKDKKSNMYNVPLKEILDIFKKEGSVLKVAKFYNMSDNGLRAHISKRVGIERSQVLKYLKAERN